MTLSSMDGDGQYPLSPEEAKNPIACFLLCQRYMLRERGDAYPHPGNVFLAMDTVFNKLLGNIVEGAGHGA